MNYSTFISPTINLFIYNIKRPAILLKTDHIAAQYIL